MSDSRGGAHAPKHAAPKKDSESSGHIKLTSEPLRTPAAPVKKEKKRKKGRPRTGKIALCVVLFLLLLVLALVIFVSQKLGKIDYSDGKISQIIPGILDKDEDEGELVDISGLEMVEPTALPEGDIVSDKNVFNILLLGTDDRDLQFSEDARADSIMLLSLNFKEGTGKLVSFERGMGVPILSGPYAGQYDWITHCFRYGGADLMLQEIRECFKVDVQHYMRVNLNALIKVVDALGGIDVELTKTEAWYLNASVTGGNFGGYASGNIYRGDWTSEVQSDLKEGMNHLTGAMAVGYARLRAIDSDWQRIVRQRTVIQACADSLKSADLLTLNRVADEVLPLVQTNLSQTEILGLMVKAPSMLGIVFDQMTIPADGTYGGMTGMEGRGMFWPDFEVNIQILHDFIYGKKA